MSNIRSQERESQDFATKAARLVDAQLLPMLLGSYVAATLIPGPGQLIRKTVIAGTPLTLISLAVLLFLAGLAIDRGQVREALRRWWLMAAALGVLWAAPWAAIEVLERFPIALPQGVLLGLALVALMPTAASSVAWSHLSRGNMTLSIGLLAASTLIAPLVLAVMTPFQTGAAGGATVVRLIAWVLVAVAAGALVRYAIGGERVTAFHPQRKLLSAGLLLLLNYANASLALPQVYASLDGGVVAMVAGGTVFVGVLAFGVAWLLARLVGLAPATRDAVVFGVGMKNTGMALVLAGLWLEDYPLATLAIILYTLLQHVLAAGYHRLSRPKQADSPRSE